MTGALLLCLAVSAAPPDGGCDVCEVFDSPARAFARVMEGKPQVLAVGEYHEQKGAPKVPSAVKRFARDLLPSLKGTATSLIVETWMLSGKCGEAEKQATAAVQKTTKRPKETEDEVTLLLDGAWRMGVKNHILIVDCDDYRSMLGDDGELDADKTLKLVRNRVEEKALEAREKDEWGAPGTLLLLYGGALHNDLHPAPVDALYSFGPALHQATDGGYVELDLLVPEYVAQDAELKVTPWFAEALRLSARGKTVLIRPQPGVALLLFARTRRGKR